MRADKRNNPLYGLLLHSAIPWPPPDMDTLLSRPSTTNRRETRTTLPHINIRLQQATQVNTLTIRVRTGPVSSPGPTTTLKLRAPPAGALHRTRAMSTTSPDMISRATIPCHSNRHRLRGPATHLHARCGEGQVVLTYVIPPLPPTASIVACNHPLCPVSFLLLLSRH